MFDNSFFNNKKILLTGHTGFKGTWMAQALSMLGADVTGYSLEPPTTPSLFKLCGIENHLNSIYGDVRDLAYLQHVMKEVQPEIVIHMAAQPIVRESYQDPVYTYETNVMGTVNILEAVRHTESVKSFLNVTTDKVYKNREWAWGYRENEELNGYDPYSNSKSCSELVTESYKNSFFLDREIAISTARAGNVIGGGDFAKDRIVPDCFRSVENKDTIVVRNPYSVRPYQHVLEPVMAYLQIVAEQYGDCSKAGSYNVGPEETDCIRTGELVSLFCGFWNKKFHGAEWVSRYDGGPHEANFLKLDCSKIKAVFGWHPKWGVQQAIEKSVEWYQCYLSGTDIVSCMEKQIKDYTAFSCQK